jgi:hypothetical protein
MSDSREQWGPIGSEQEGESGAFRAPKGEEFPTGEPRMGHCVSVGAKGQWGSLGEIEMTAIFKGLREFTLLNSGNSTDDP